MAEPPVVEASPLIVLAQGGWLQLLQKAGEGVIVPRAVEREIRRSGATDPIARLLAATPWLEVVSGRPLSHRFYKRRSRSRR